MADHTAGDPCSSLKWKRKSLRQVSGALGAKHPASAPTVARLLRTRDYSLKVNHKQLTVSSPHRNEQFLYLQAQKEAFLPLPNKYPIAAFHCVRSTCSKL